MTQAQTEAPPTQGDVRWSQDADGIVTLTMDARDKGANTMSERFLADFESAVTRLADDAEALRGVIVTSGKKSYFAGGDLDEMLAYRPEDAAEIAAGVDRIKALLRRLEQLPVPVVAAINGAALGGGLEIALACHRRIASDASHVRIGLPEVTLGLLPGGGGVTRTVRLLGLESALSNVLLEGQSYTAQAAAGLGLVDEVVEADRLLPAARDWILATDAPQQPWDAPGYRLPGPRPEVFAAGAFAGLSRRLRGAPFPAPHAILAAAIEGARVDIDTALRVETRYFVSLAVSQTAKNMIRGGFIDAQTVRSGAARPTDVPPAAIASLGVVGAGMMGAGIAYVAAQAGLRVVLRDLTAEAAEKGKDYSRMLVGKAVDRGRQTREDGDALLQRITTTADLADLAGVDAVIEAVFESPDLKKEVYRELARIAPDAVIASNTSTLPIGDLATASADPTRFVGMHFFSPVDRMPLLEIVRGAQTSDDTLAVAYDLGVRLRKTPIVVNDGRGFFTSRVITQHIDEAIAMVGEGIPVPVIEHAATQNGFPVGPLQLVDETSLSLPHRVRRENREAAAAAGTAWTEHPAERVMTAMVETFERPGRAAGAGFYEYREGQRAGVWAGLAVHFPPSTEVPFDDVRDRLIFVEALEAVRTLDDGILRSTAEGNVGSLLGIGFPKWTGGVIQFVNGYPGGISAFVARADELADRYGERFRPPVSLRDLAASGEDAQIV